MDIVPLADAVTLPVAPLPRSVRVLPALHGLLLGDRPALSLARAFLNHDPVRGGSALRGTAALLAATASAWRMPQTPSSGWRG